jgi:hypothetical protein
MTIPTDSTVIIEFVDDNDEVIDEIELSAHQWHIIELLAESEDKEVDEILEELLSNGVNNHGSGDPWLL